MHTSKEETKLTMEMNRLLILDMNGVDAFLKVIKGARIKELEIPGQQLQ